MTEQSLISRGVTVNTTVIDVVNANTAPSLQEGELITIGTRAASFAYKNYPGVAVTSALVTRSGFEQLAQQSFGGVDQALRHGVAPLLLDQPLSRFFTLGSLLVPAAQTVGILVGPANENRLPDILASAKAAGFEVNIALLKPDDNPIQIIEPVVKSSDFFVVIPDRKLINQLAAKWVLPLSYRYRKPVIAYSQKYVEAGALASVFSSPEDVAVSIADSVLKVAANGNRSARFSVSLNSSVARSLGIDLQEAGQYASQLRTLEVVAP